MEKPKKILIIGSTPLASLLASHLVQEGRRVNVVDRPGADFSAFGPTLSASCLTGDPLAESVLRRSGVESAGVVIAISANDDLNLAAGIICVRFFEVSRVVALVQDPQKAVAFGNLGVKIICPTGHVERDVLTAAGVPGTRVPRTIETKGRVPHQKDA